MKTLLAAVLLAATAAVAQEMSQPQNQNASPLKGGAVSVHETDLTARVEKVDRKKNQVTLKDPKGEKIKIVVPPDVKSLENVQPGSKLKIHYLQATALAIAKPETAAAPMAMETVHVAPKSGTPADVEVNTAQATGSIQDLDRSKREVTIKTPDDRKMTFQIAEDVPGFDQAKIGYKVVIRYTQAMALSAESQTTGKMRGMKY